MGLELVADPMVDMASPVGRVAVRDRAAMDNLTPMLILSSPSKKWWGSKGAVLGRPWCSLYAVVSHVRYHYRYLL